MSAQSEATEDSGRIGLERHVEIAEAFDAAWEPHQRAWRNAHTSVPERLYHYTTLDGLKGMITSGCIWASDVRFMNDASELSYASGLVAEETRRVFESTSDERAKVILPHTSTILNAFDVGPRPFSACFCTDPDLLSQWRGYTNSQVGYSLGLDFRFPLEGHSDFLPPPLLRKVIYDPEEQRSWVRRITEQWLNTGFKLLDTMTDLSPADVFVGSPIRQLGLALSEQHLCFKHQGFEEESEWRFIILVDVNGLQPLGQEPSEGQEVKSQPTPEIMFRPTSLGLVPYVELPLRAVGGPFKGKLPLYDIKQGPVPNRELSLQSLHLYLKYQGFHVTNITASEIPLRSDHR